MAKRIIRLTENKLKQIICVATKDVIKELQEATVKQAALCGGANASASRDYAETKSIDSKSKMNRADLLRLPLLTKALIDKFGNFKIELVEHNNQNHMTYVNYFVFDCVVLIDSNSYVMKGEISIGGRPYSVGYIRYIFTEDKWQRVRCGTKLQVSEISQLEPFEANLPLVNSIIDSIENFIEQEAQNISQATTGQRISSKSRKPLSSKSRMRLYGDYIRAYNKKKATTPTELL